MCGYPVVMEKFDDPWLAFVLRTTKSDTRLLTSSLPGAPYRKGRQFRLCVFKPQYRNKGTLVNAIDVL